ncbi:maleylpyruvate isomerase N-terminal domain-containing protein [Aquihabitans sp. McL0605]|uniref:maleylpyruvate isomerase N-terminal domain-containing protein n=1 Tax=Aquihabitans sp. McL0605 TaxID=3415671 RepID=UPI003CF1A134
MSDRTFDPVDTLTAYREAGHWWRSLVGGVDDHQWDLMALGEWTVRELVAHGARAFRTVSEYIEGDTKDPTRIDTAAQYFGIVLAEQTPHVHIANRARKEAREEADWVAATDKLWASAELVVSNVPGDTDVHLFVGEMEIGQYLATRIVELVVHGGDLAEAIGIPSAPPLSAARISLDVLIDLASGTDVATILRLLTGRSGALPLHDVLA